MRRGVFALAVILFTASLVSANEGLFVLARENGKLANNALKACQRYTEGWLRHADHKTGLIPKNLSKGKDIWNPQDSAADNYPYMVLTSAITNREMFDGLMLDILRTETKLTSRLDRIPDAYSFSKGGFVDEKPNLGRIIFGGSEYVKDGLIPLTEWLGPSPWSERMLGILDDIWKHAPIDTKYGKIPSTRQEVNGEMLQTLSRVYWMTGQKKYLDYAFRLADYYLFDHHPTRDAKSLRLSDHSCEILAGLSEIYLTAHYAAPEKKKAYQKAIHVMFDRVLEIGRNEHGLFYAHVNTQTGRVVRKMLVDTWGYTYNGVYTVYLVDKTEAYRKAVQKVLTNLNKHYKNHVWEPVAFKADQYADAIEGAINLFNREPILSVGDWIDHNTKILLDMQKPDGTFEGWHGDGNVARTAIMYALWKTKGLTVRPWREDIRLGAKRSGKKLYVTIAGDAPWEGKVCFDQPRHKTYMKLPIDYPRINQFPEWFTAEAEERYEITIGNQTRSFSGSQLWEGVDLMSKRNGFELRMEVQPRGLVKR